MNEPQRRDRQLIERGVPDILGDTFSIYWRHFRKFIILVAVINAPIGALELLLNLIFPDSRWTLISVGFIDATASMLVYGAAIFAVGQHFLADHISVERCYVRVAWRMVSVATPALIVGIILAFILWQATGIPDVSTSQDTLEPDEALGVLLGVGIVIAALVALIILSIYLVAAMPAIIVEGYRSRGAFLRSSQLLMGNKWRVIGHLLIYSLGNYRYVVRSVHTLHPYPGNAGVVRRRAVHSRLDD